MILMSNKQIVYDPKIEIVTTIHTNQLADEIFSQLSVDDAFELIVNVEFLYGDLDLTRRLHEYFKEELQKEGELDG